MMDDALKENEKWFKAIFDNAGEGILLADLENKKFFLGNKKICAMLGCDMEEIKKWGVRDIHPEESLPYVLSQFEKQTRGEITLARDIPVKRKDGSVFYADVNSTKVAMEGRQYLSGFFRDVTERRQVEEELRRNQRLFSSISRIQAEFIDTKEPHAVFELMLEELLELTGSAYGFMGEVLQTAGGDPILKTHALSDVAWNEETRLIYGQQKNKGLEFRNLNTLFGAALRTGEPVIANDPLHDPRRGGLPEGHPPLTSFMALPCRLGGRMIGLVGMANRTKGYDEGLVQYLAPFLATCARLIEAVGLRREQHKLQTQLLQSQKMEAVGRLAGGVAHDFNNMLGIIIGHAELALDDVEPGHAMRVHFEEIDKAARRSADLTGQLLAFARKQVVAPKVLDMNDTVAGMLRMLRRLIGEDIDLAWMPGRELWPVRIDPAQIDQIMANLCVNARDAISGVGSVTIETENVFFDAAYCTEHPGFIPGAYVMLSISDDGRGMEREVFDNLFEPFFTTKEVGQGTGLGLATVYGIVKQNEGFINVYSEPGTGTTFRIYLPRYTGEKVSSPVYEAAEGIRGGTETILLVEDEERLLELGRKMLQALGYKVHTARTPTQALALAEAHVEEIRLLITDVVLPEMNGRELAERTKALRPGIGCLFMSGYTANVIAHRGVLEEGVHFLQKPFSIGDLAAGARAALDSNR